ncbi:uncharacterized protein LOC130641523 [Hydractinia symbiolongicarpus]|uniref:uncharacterized protein LOC130641523 n=1 Tax=Hydractinia symbiolongicarpus TaxID=13093 RepID=UPI00254EE7B7|nr:uncharacterized protein LOC130641523 [Hydractinia symbiolongicarpus]
MSNKKTTKTAVNFLDQFAKDFIRGYGPATKEETGSDDDFRKKLKSFTCEWLNRPNVALSELSETIEENLPLLGDKKLNNMVKDRISKVKESLQPFNRKSEQEKPSKSNLKTAFRPGQFFLYQLSGVAYHLIFILHGVPPLSCQKLENCAI